MAGTGNGPVCATNDGAQGATEPGPCGVNYCPLTEPFPAWCEPISGPASTKPGYAEPMSGAVQVGVGLASVVRIPVPNSGGLFIELSPAGYVPKAGSTSTLFIQSLDGKQQLRLDYGYNKVSGKVDYHWNQKGTFDRFGIKDHTTVGKAGEALYKGARYFKYAGRVLLVVGLAVDVYSIVVAEKKWRQVAKVAAGWAGATAGCETVGAGGAYAGTFVEPGLGTAVGGILGCVVGGIGGYAGASWAAGRTYDWVEETFFTRVPEFSPAP